MAKPGLRLGIVGAGKMASWHLRAYRRIPGVRLEAIANPSSDRGRRLAARHGIPRCFRDALEMIRTADLDAVDICTPTPLHRPCILAALERGLHVYVEKPMCESVAEADEIVSANRAAGRVVFNGFNYRYWPEMRRIAEIVRSGRAGAVRFAQMRRVTKDSPRQVAENAREAEIFSGFHSHFIDLLFAFGFPDPESVFVSGTSVLDWPMRPDTAVLLLRFPGGAAAEITTSAASPGLTPEMLLIGTRGTVRLDYGRVRATPHRDEWRLTRLVVMMFRDAVTVPWRVLRNPFLPSCRHFVACAREGRPSDSDEHAARRVLRVAAAAERSYFENKPVALSDH